MVRTVVSFSKALTLDFLLLPADRRLWLQAAEYILCSDVSNVIVIERRHVGGMINVNKDWVITRKYENSYVKVFRKPYFSTSVQFHTTVCKHTQFILVTQYTSNITLITVVDRMTLLSPYVLTIDNHA